MLSAHHSGPGLTCSEDFFPSLRLIPLPVTVTRLLIVIPTLDQSGAEKQFALLAGGLPKDRFEIRVVALSRGGPFEASLHAAGIPYSILGKRWRLDPRTILRLRREIQEFRPDVVLSGLFAANASVRLATWRLHPRPVTIISERCVDSWKAGWQLWLDRRLQKRTDCLVANSQSVSGFYAAQGFPRDKIRVIPNGVDRPAASAVSRTDFLQQCQLPEDAKVIMYVGRLAPQKRLKCLIWAMQILRQADPRAYFLIIGTGPDAEMLRFYARDVESISHIRFLGHRQDAGSLLQHCDVFWLASEFEGMSNSLMEAMACGKPVVVSDIPPNRELVRHEQDGYLVTLGDSVGFSQFTGKLLADADLAARLGKSGQDRMEQEFSTEQMVSRYAALVQEELVRMRS